MAGTPAVFHPPFPQRKRFPLARVVFVFLGLAVIGGILSFVSLHERAITPLQEAASGAYVPYGEDPVFLSEAHFSALRLEDAQGFLSLFSQGAVWIITGQEVGSAMPIGTWTFPDTTLRLFSQLAQQFRLSSFTFLAPMSGRTPVQAVFRIVEKAGVVWEVHATLRFNTRGGLVEERWETAPVSATLGGGYVSSAH